MFYFMESLLEQRSVVEAPLQELPHVKQRYYLFDAYSPGGRILIFLNYRYCPPSFCVYSSDEVILSDLNK